MALHSGRALGLFCILCLVLSVTGQLSVAETSRWVAQDEADQSTALIQHGVRARRRLHSASPHGWIVNRTLDKKAYFDLHIPKTAGMSFSYDVKEVLPKDEGYYSEELCWYGAKPMVPGDEMVAFLRDPTSHIYSQYLECKYDLAWFPVVRMNYFNPAMQSVTTWLLHFRGGTGHEALGCYDPYNMQTRAFTCTQEYHKYSPIEMSSHFYHAEPDLALATRNLDSLFFVGITEHYHTSLCLFFAKTHASAPLPSHCDCTDKEAWNSWSGTHFDHGEPPHSNSELSEEDLRMIRELSRLDKVLYEHALERFRREAVEVEATRGTKILCESEEGTPSATLQFPWLAQEPLHK